MPGTPEGVTNGGSAAGLLGGQVGGLRFERITEDAKGADGNIVRADGLPHLPGQFFEICRADLSPEVDGEAFKSVRFDLPNVTGRVGIARDERADANIEDGVFHGLMVTRW